MNQSKSKHQRNGDLVEVLRGEMVDSGMTMYELSQRSGVDRKNLRLFLHGEAGITLDTAARLAGVLELELVPRRGRRGGTQRARKLQPPAERPDELVLDRSFPSEDLVIHRDYVIPGPPWAEQELSKLIDPGIEPSRPGVGPVAQCSNCKRKTWDPSQVRDICRMTQPNGDRCAGWMLPP